MAIIVYLDATRVGSTLLEAPSYLNPKCLIDINLSVWGLKLEMLVDTESETDLLLANILDHEVLHEWYFRSTVLEVDDGWELQLG